MTTPREPNDLKQEFFSFEFEAPGVAPVAATGSILCAADAAAGDGDTVTVGDGINPAIVFEYDKTSNGVAGTNTTWAVGTTAASNATALRLLILAKFPSLSVVDNLAGLLTITHLWPGSGGNVTITETGSVCTTVTGMSGGAGPATYTATTTTKHRTAQRTMRVDKVEYINPTGFTGHASNYWELSLKKGTTVMAQWSTDSDVAAEGTITANTPVNLTLSATVANQVAAVGDVLSFALTKVASAAALPAGRFVVHGRYV